MVPLRNPDEGRGEVERRFSKDELLTNTMIYWVTQTINSSIRGYYEGMHAQWEESAQSEQWEQRSDLHPIVRALFSKEPRLPEEGTG